MKRTRNGILIPDVPIMAGGNLPNAVKGVSAGGSVDSYTIPFYIDVLTSLDIKATNRLQISDDTINWSDVTENMSLAKGRYYFRIENSNVAWTINNTIVTETGKYINIGGNINSLVTHDFKEDRCYVYSNIFQGLNILDAKDLLLPRVAELTPRCFYYTFAQCKSLISVPKFPYTQLAEYCYAWMFYGCESLSTPIDLPATTLYESCYQSLYQGCKNLEIAPILPAATLVTNCYSGMLYQCSKINRIECFAENVTATGALTNWVTGVAANGTFVKKRGVSYASGNNGIPTGWTVEEID